jgi:hypothetical protein
MIPKRYYLPAAKAIIIGKPFTPIPDYVHKTWTIDHHNVDRITVYVRKYDRSIQNLDNFINSLLPVKPKNTIILEMHIKKEFKNIQTDNIVYDYLANDIASKLDFKVECFTYWS